MTECKHDPVHFHTKAYGGLWLCLNCKAGGEKLPPEEVDVLIEFAKELRKKDDKCVVCHNKVCNCTPVRTALQ